MPQPRNKQKVPLAAQPVPPIPMVPTRPQPQRKHRGLWLMVVVWLVLFGLLLANRQSISDWWRLRGYVPPAAVAGLASQDTMTPYARHLFYLNKPGLLSSVSSFRAHCPQNENAVVLGCYHPGEGGIYIYNVQDPKLQGVTQVTAAHEDLHAIYARLSPKDRAYVDKLLEDYYKNGLTDSQVKAEIDQYKKSEPGAVVDEMHSVFGTEIANLPPPLEAYYKQYFSNRAAIIAYQQRYESEFSNRRSAVARDDAQLAAMKSQIDSQQTTLDAQLKQINATKSRLNSLRDSDAAAYNAAVPGYNSQIDSYNATVASLKRLITQYNQLVVARNTVAGELNTLDKALDTRSSQQTAQ